MRRHAMDLAQVGVAVYLSLDVEKNSCRKAKIALGAVAQTPIRAPIAEQILMNREMSQQLAKEAGEAHPEKRLPEAASAPRKNIELP